MSIDFRKQHSTDFHIDMTEVYKILETLQDIPERAMLAFNDAIKASKTRANKIIAKHVAGRYDINEDSIGRFGKGAKATATWEINPAKMSAGIRFTGKRLTLHHFPHSPTSRPNNRKYRVTATIKNGNALRFGNRTFISSTGAKSADKVQSIPFMRTGEWVKPDPTRNAKSFRLKNAQGRANRTGLIEKIRPVYTLSVPQMVQNRQLREPIERDLQQLLMKSFMSKTKKILAKRAGGR